MIDFGREMINENSGAEGGGGGVEKEGTFPPRKETTVYAYKPTLRKNNGGCAEQRAKRNQRTNYEPGQLSGLHDR